MSSSFCPPLEVYAAIQMDPTAMVAHLDARAAEEAQKIRPKTYLIFTAFGSTIPFPGRNWYVYNVRPIGPSLRVVDEKRGFESDMCVPIFPNETHPTGRPAVHPDGVFPYDNCYHWARMKLDVRVHAREEGFDDTRAIELSVGEQMDMEALFRTDLGRSHLTRLARKQAASVPPDHASPPALESSSAQPSAEHSKDVAASDEDDVFEPPEDFEDPEYIPLVHLWLDLEENLKQEDIGDPVDLYKERFAIMSIIRRAHERNPDLPTLREHLAPHQDSHVDDSDSDSYMNGTVREYGSEADEPEPSDRYVSKPKRFRPAKLLRKLGSGVRGMFCIPI